MIWTVVTTSPGYDKELQGFLETFPSENKLIIVFQNEDLDLIDQFSENIFRVFSKRNLYEYGAWPAVQRLLDAGHASPDDRFFMVHDTCRMTATTFVGLQFLPDHDVFWAHADGCHNICVTKGSAVKPVTDYLILDTFMTKERAREIEGKLHLVSSGLDHFFAKCSSNFIKDLCTEDRVCCWLESVKILKYFKGHLDDFIV